MTRYLHCLAYLCFFFAGISQDTINTNYPGSNQKWERVYKNDQKIVENIYYLNGNQWMTAEYDAKEEETWKWYYENGNPYFEATIINDQIQGTYTIWYENGQLAEILIFKDNLEDGPAVFYYPNGQIAMQGYYENGEMVGEWNFFGKNGNLPDGKWDYKFAASNENTRIKGAFAYGNPIGKWIYKTTANQGLKNQKVFKLSFD